MLIMTVKAKPFGYSAALRSLDSPAQHAEPIFNIKKTKKYFVFSVVTSVPGGLSVKRHMIADTLPSRIFLRVYSTIPVQWSASSL